MTGQRKYQIAACLIFVLWTALVLAQSLARTDGMLIYSLDDPYIHLSVAEMILQGGYGINEGEAAAPSSSILYPVLLAGLSAIGLDWSGPLLLNVVPAIAVVWLLAGALWPVLQTAQGRAGGLLLMLSLPMLILALNLAALPMTGMEHPLHMLATVMAGLSLLRLGQTGKAGGLLIAGVVLAPLIRFEGLALAAASVLVLFASGHRRLAAGLGLIVLALVGGFMAMLKSLGLGALPSSVLTKSSVARGAVEGDVWAALLASSDQLLDELTRAPDLPLILAALFMVFVMRQKEAQALRPFAAVVSLTLLAHVLLGSEDIIGRYENYAYALAILGVGTGLAYLAQRSTLILRFGSIAVLAFLWPMASGHVLYWRVTPPASANIYSQQYQMHRFATQFFKHNLVANDIGLVSFKNPAHVLDIYGLGSEEARQIRANRAMTPGDIEALSAKSDARYAMIYSGWLSYGLPAGWCPIGALQTQKVTAASGTVEIFLIDRSLEVEMRKAMDAFADTLPDQAILDRHACR